jgi:putative ABC transport system permease protein
LAVIDAAWRGLLPNIAINRHFLDDEFELLFNAQKKEGKIFAVFSIFTVLASCLGLFGLATFLTQSDGKQIAIRRIFGASRAMIIRWQLARFTSLIVIACIIAWPVAAYCLHIWLEGFAHQVELKPMIFLLVGLGALGIAWITVIGHIIHAAGIEPIRILRFEE